MARRLCRLWPLLLAGLSVAGCAYNPTGGPEPAGRWQDRVGTAPFREGRARLQVTDFGAIADGKTSSTAAIQKAIDTCTTQGGGSVSFAPGTYVTGSLFLKSNVELIIPAGVTLLGSENDAEYPIIHTRAGGIELDWPAAVLNVRDATNVRITGGGTVNARGARWWNKFFTALPDYERRGLRWAVDYDTGRPLLLQVFKSTDVSIDNLQFQESPFWTVDVVYSERVTVQKITIRNNRPGLTPNKGPSTDGINIDSSRFVLVQNCDVDCNDDCYSFKSGMNADGLRVNRPCEYVLFRHNIARAGDGGITVGSDMSGGVRHVEAYDFTCIGTKEGLRLKSARVRGGVVEDVYFHNFQLTNVPKPISFNLDWFPAFSYPVLPTDGTPIKPHWRVMAEVVPADKAIPTFRNITIADVTATGARDAISVLGLKERPLANVRLEHINIQAANAGSVRNAENWDIRDVHITTPDHAPVRVTDCQGVIFPPPAP